MLLLRQGRQGPALFPRAPRLLLLVLQCRLLFREPLPLLPPCVP